MLAAHFGDEILPVAQIVASSQPYVNKFFNDLRLTAQSNRSAMTNKPYSNKRIRINSQEQVWSLPETSNSYTFYRQNSQRSKKSVGPGSYEIQFPAHLQQNRPCATFSKSHRKQLEKFQNPGPGQYNIIQKIKSKTFVFNSRQNSEYHQQSPGPGTYELNQKSCRSISIGTASYQSQPNSHFITPGPGAYKIDYKVNRKKIDRIERLLKPKVMVRSFYNRKEDKYIQELEKQKETKEQSERQKRPKSAMQIKQAARRRKMETIRRSLHVKFNPPGPGSYQIKDFIQIDQVDKKNENLQKSNSEKKSNSNNPLGPGSYEIKDFLCQSEYIKKSNINSSFGKSKRFKDEKYSELGPGSYEIVDEEI
ncbi:unnamed protein product (macronuclear) [Paramecium tetraurelia]|uniref:Uncharacterized protein n=1 Tax=Paramecium tetraurelia TaxID=5888 RepID=A0BR93_PARTE|nr:uncharacterized protein GSPATT00031291001 [Paramecium tetraurelia]CAK61060.1 unnamed protein product [Paramecium tetraurelia]|eukprot:XP_001428458.1 hypothetical protein (macronuclear) [Paramecium tetraurelia strain d4-2]